MDDARRVVADDRITRPAHTIKASTILPDLDRYTGPPLEFGRMEATASDPAVPQQFGMIAGIPNAGQLNALVRLHTAWPPALNGGAPQYGIQSNLRLETFNGPNAGVTEVLIPAGYVTIVYDPIFALSPDGTCYVSVPSDTPTTLPEPGLPFSLVFRAEPGREDVLPKIASAYEAASKRRGPPPAFGPLSEPLQAAAP